MKRLFLLLIVSFVMVAGTGCGLLHTIAYGPLGCTPSGCGGTSCGTASCGPNLGTAGCGASCGATCNTGCGVGYGGYGGYGVGACGVPCGPLAWLFGLFHAGSYWGSSCGETYWGDFHSDPPNCQDPCNSCGNWTGSPGRSAGGCSSCGIASQQPWSPGYVGTRPSPPRIVARPNRTTRPLLQATRPGLRRY